MQEFDALEGKNLTTDLGRLYDRGMRGRKTEFVPTTIGAKQLYDFIGGFASQKEAAEFLGVSPSQMNRWLRGKARPDSLMAVMLHQQVKIHPEMWFLDFAANEKLKKV